MTLRDTNIGSQPDYPPQLGPGRHIVRLQQCRRRVWAEGPRAGQSILIIEGDLLGSTVDLGLIGSRASFVLREGGRHGNREPRRAVRALLKCALAEVTPALIEQTLLPGSARWSLAGTVVRVTVRSRRSRAGCDYVTVELRVRREPRRREAATGEVATALARGRVRPIGSGSR